MGGSYMSLWAGNSGDMGNLITMLSGGFEIGKMELEPDQETWSKMLHMFSNDNHQEVYLATLSLGSEFGMVDVPTFSIIRCVELQGGDIKLVQVRNSLGRACT
jgi:hypothetical protein